MVKLINREDKRLSVLNRIMKEKHEENIQKRTDKIRVGILLLVTSFLITYVTIQNN